MRGKAWLKVVLALCIPVQGFALTLSEIRTEARVLALDNGSTRRRFSDARLNSFINEAQRAVVLEARPILKSAQFELAAGTTYYSLPADYLQINRVTLDWQILYETTPEAQDRSAEWQLVGAEPTHYYIHFASRTKIGFYPFPDTSGNTGTVRFEYWAQATDLSADADVPFNAITELIPYHYALAQYAAAHMAAIDGKGGLASLYLTEYRATIERMKSEAKSRPSYRPGASASNTGPPR